MLSGWILSLLSDDASFDVYWDTKISSLMSGKPIFHSASMCISNKLGIELNCASPWNLAEISYSLLAVGPQNQAQFFDAHERRLKILVHLSCTKKTDFEKRRTGKSEKCSYLFLEITIAQIICISFHLRANGDKDEAKDH